MTRKTAPIAPEPPPSPPAPPGLVVESMAIDGLHADPANVRRHPERNLDAIRASLARFGQQKPIVVDSDGVVRAGNGTLEAARALGWDRIDAVRSDLSPVELAAYSISDNRTSELAEWDDDALAATLRALQAEDFDLDAVGFTDAEVDALFGADGVEIPDPQLQQEPELKSEHFVEIYCSAADLEAFRPTFDAWMERDGVTINVS